MASRAYRSVRRVRGSFAFVLGVLALYGVTLAILRIIWAPGEASIVKTFRTTVQLSDAGLAQGLPAAGSPASPAGAAAPSVGATQTTPSGVSVTLVSVESLSEIKEYPQATRPSKGLYKLVTVRFANPTGAPATVAASKIALVKSDGTRVPVDNAGSLGLQETKGKGIDAPVRARALFLNETIGAGRDVTLLVAFDLEPSVTKLSLNVEGAVFALPD
ncbi:MAG: hypothetical protein FJ029_03830 [Actinobacteria bacterium]|nr:hypothetical protein [Actinomycetota bacterium]